MKKTLSHSLEETSIFAKEIIESIYPHDSGAFVIGLYGNLGSGKTALTKAIAKEMGVTDIVTSPTFIIEKIYETNSKYFPRLIHIDAYRLERASELQVLDFERLVENKNNLIIIEWPEKVIEIIPTDHKKIYCEFVDETTRKFEVQ